MSALFLLPELIKKDKTQLSIDFKSTFQLKPLIFISLIGFSNYTGNFLHLLAANHVPASVQFPLVSGGVIVLSAIVSAFVFKEKLTKKEWISIAGAFIATFLFAF